MSYPVSDKATMALRKAGYQRIIGQASAWAAHLKRLCHEACWYCHIERKR